MEIYGHKCKSFIEKRNKCISELVKTKLDNDKKIAEGRIKDKKQIDKIKEQNEKNFLQYGHPLFIDNENGLDQPSEVLLVDMIKEINGIDGINNFIDGNFALVRKCYYKADWPDREDTILNHWDTVVKPYNETRHKNLRYNWRIMGNQEVYKALCNKICFIIENNFFITPDPDNNPYGEIQADNQLNNNNGDNDGKFNINMKEYIQHTIVSLFLFNRKIIGDEDFYDDSEIYKKDAMCHYRNIIRDAVGVFVRVITSFEGYLLKQKNMYKVAGFINSVHDVLLVLKHCNFLSIANLDKLSDMCSNIVYNTISADNINEAMFGGMGDIHDYHTYFTNYLNTDVATRGIFCDQNCDKNIKLGYKVNINDRIRDKIISAIKDYLDNLLNISIEKAMQGIGLIKDIRDDKNVNRVFRDTKLSVSVDKIIKDCMATIQQKQEESQQHIEKQQFQLENQQQEQNEQEQNNEQFQQEFQERQSQQQKKLQQHNDDQQKNIVPEEDSYQEFEQKIKNKVINKKQDIQQRQQDELFRIDFQKHLQQQYKIEDSNFSNKNINKNIKNLSIQQQNNQIQENQIQHKKKKRFIIKRCNLEKVNKNILQNIYLGKQNLLPKCNFVISGAKKQYKIGKNQKDQNSYQPYRPIPHYIQKKQVQKENDLITLPGQKRAMQDMFTQEEIKKKQGDIRNTTTYKTEFIQK